MSKEMNIMSDNGTLAHCLERVWPEGKEGSDFDFDMDVDKGRNEFIALHIKVFPTDRQLKLLKKLLSVHFDYDIYLFDIFQTTTIVVRRKES